MIPVVPFDFPIAMETAGALALTLLLVVLMLSQRMRGRRARREIERLRLELAGAENRLMEAKRQVSLLSNIDSVTGLVAAHVVEERFQLALALSRRHKIFFATLVMQVAGFEQIVHRQGSEIADRLLAAVGARLMSVTRESDTVGRLDECQFAILLPVLNGPDDISVVVGKLRVAMERRFELPGVDEAFRLLVHFGAASYPKDGDDWPTVLKAAETHLSRNRTYAVA